MVFQQIYSVEFVTEYVKNELQVLPSDFVLDIQLGPSGIANHEINPEQR